MVYQKHRDAADGVSRNCFAPFESKLRSGIRSTQFPGEMNCRGDNRHYRTDEDELSYFDADVEEKKGDRDGVLRETDFA